MADIGKIVASSVITLGDGNLGYQVVLDLGTDADEPTKFSWTVPAEIESCRLVGWSVFQNTSAGTLATAASLLTARMHLELAQKNPGGFNPWLVWADESKFITGQVSTLSTGVAFEILKQELEAAGIMLEGSDVVDCFFPVLDTNGTPTADAECHIIISGVVYHKKS